MGDGMGWGGGWDEMGWGKGVGGGEEEMGWGRGGGEGMGGGGINIWSSYR